MSSKGLLVGLLFCFATVTYAEDFVPNQLLVVPKSSGTVSIQSGRGPLEALCKSLDLKASVATKSIPVRMNAKKGLSAQDTQGPDRIYTLNFTNLDDTQKALLELKKSPQIAHVQPNYIYKASFIPNDPFYSSDQTYFSDLGIPSAWDITSGNSNTVVGVIDSGLYTSHNDIATNVWTNPKETLNGIDDDGNGLVDDINGWNFASSNSNLTDTVGHGSHVSGTIAAKTNNNLGIAGVAPNCKIMVLKVGESSTFLTSTIVEALQYAMDHKAAVVNMSLGGAATDNLFHQKVIEVANQNIALIAAAGNESVNVDTQGVIPASYPEVIAVSATTQPGTFDSRYSNFGPSISLAAPGTSIRSLSTVQNDFKLDSGTSMAAPHVSGIAALLKSKAPSLTNSALKTALTSTATDKGTAGKDNFYGYGIPNALLALQSISDSVPPTITHTAITTKNASQSVLVTATITDNFNAPITATLYYRSLYNSTPRSNWTSVSMSKGSGNSYSATIPAVLPGNTVQYYLKAVDEQLNSRVFPSTAPTTPLSFALTDNVAPTITFLTQDNDYFSKTSPLIALVTDNVSVATNSITVYLTQNNVTTSYVYPNSILSLSGSKLSVNLSSLSLDSSGLIFKVSLKDIYNQATTAQVTLKQSNQLDLADINSAIKGILNAPNPFDPYQEPTYLCYQLTVDAAVTHSIYSLKLSKVFQSTINDTAGYHEVRWDGRDLSGNIVSNGVYIWVLEAEAQGKKIVRKHKIAVLKR